MKKGIVAALLSVFVAAGCTVGFVGGHRGSELVIVPSLPVTVEIGEDQYYEHSGYFYRYQGNVWVYSQTRQGPWLNLPRKHYPREVRYRRHVVR